jgi:hypothetical protein
MQISAYKLPEQDKITVKTVLDSTLLKDRFQRQANDDSEKRKAS